MATTTRKPPPAKKATRTTKKTSKPPARVLIPYPTRWASFTHEEKAAIVGEDSVEDVERLLQADEADREAMTETIRARLRVLVGRLEQLAIAEAEIRKERRKRIAELALLGERQTDIAKLIQTGNMIVNDALGITQKKR